LVRWEINTHVKADESPFTNSCYFGTPPPVSQGGA
jgi:hypothetical protein